MADREITLKTPIGPDKLLFAALEGFDEIGLPFAFQLRMASEDPEIDVADLLGQPVTITVGRKGTPRHIHALVADMGFLDFAEGFARYRATLRPALWLLSLTTDNRIFQNKSVPDIVTAVLRGHESVRFEMRLRSTYPPREYCVQYGESDLDFIARLMEHEGIFYFFEHAEDGHLLVIADDWEKLAPLDGLDALPWQPDERANFLDGDFVVSWSAETAIRTRRYAHTDYDFEKPSANLMAKSEEPEESAAGRSEAYHYPGDFLTVGRGDALAGTRLDELRSTHRRARAQVTAPRLMSGASFKLEGFPREAENEAYVVLRADYRMWDGQYQTGMGERRGGRGDVGCEVSLDLQPQSLLFRPERRTPRPRMQGPQTAVVVGPAGEEIYTDKYSRVKVQFHWDRLGRRDESSTCFVRVSAAWAGAGWGFIQIPRIGQEVIVDFLEGNADHPIVTGRVYNAEQMPPYALPANATQSGWKSNSSPGGGGFNELRFEDKKGSEQVYFQAEKDHVELVKNDESRNIGHDWKESVVNDATQTVGHDRRETVDHDKFTEVKNNRDVTIGVNDTERVGKDRSLTVEGDETIHVVGSSTENIDVNHFQTVKLAQKVLVEAGRMDQVGLAEVRAVGAYQTLTVGLRREVKVGTSQMHHVIGSDSWTVGRDETVKIGGNESIDIGGNQTVKLKGNQDWANEGGRLVKVGKGQTHEVAEDVWIKAGKSMMIEAADSITLKAGDASIELKKDGTVTVKGKDLKLDGSGKISVTADGDLILKAAKIHEN